MSQVKKFTAKIEDDYGVYPAALIAILAYDATSQSSERSVDGFDYTEKAASIGILEYEGSYYQSSDSRMAGKKSKPLLNSDDKFIIAVDLEHPESVSLINGSGLVGRELSFNLIIADIKRKFNLA